MQRKNVNQLTHFPSPLAGEGARRAGEGYMKGNTYLIPLIGFECLRTQNHFPRQGGSQTASGFTLIELLVVVLIIGILAAVALPQYQKAVEKSKATQALSLLKTTYQAAKSYQLANGSWPTSFDELAVDIPWTGKINYHKVGSAGYSQGQSNTDWSIQLKRPSSKTGAAAKDAGVVVGRISGPYVGAAFSLWMVAYPSSGSEEVPTEEIICTEGRGDESGVINQFTGKKGSYCNKLFKGTLINTQHTTRFYRLP